MSKMIAGLAAGAVLALGGVAAADNSDLNLSINGKPFYGKWTMVDQRPYVGLEALSDALNLPRKHYYKAWIVTEDPADVGDPLSLMTTADDSEVKTIRFGGVTMVDLYAVANALDLPVHHNFRNKTFQIGSNYTGEEMKGKWYRYLSRAHGWRVDTDLNRFHPVNRSHRHDREWDDIPWEPKRL